MSASAPAILTEGLGRDYGEVRALEALDLTVPAGALVGLLGPLLIVVMGLFVMGIVFAMLMPIFQMNTLIR